MHSREKSISLSLSHHDFFIKFEKCVQNSVFATFKTPWFHIDTGRKEVAKKGKKGKKKKR